LGGHPEGGCIPRAFHRSKHLLEVLFGAGIPLLRINGLNIQELRHRPRRGKEESGSPQLPGDRFSAEPVTARTGGKQERTKTAASGLSASVADRSSPTNCLGARMSRGASVSILSLWECCAIYLGFHV
jgi:hypothetical protein